MSQSRFSIVLVGVSALLRRPLVSRLRPADGERSALPSVSAFAARRVGLRAHGFRFSARTASELPSAGWPSGSRLPLFGTHRFGNCPRRVGSSAGRVGLRAHDFRFSTRTDSEWPLGGLAFGFTASAFRHAPLRSGHWASSFFRLPFRRLPSAGWPSGSLLPLFGTHRFGVAARRVGSSAFRFGDCRSAGWPSGSPLPLFGAHRFGVAARRVGSSAFRFGDCHSAGWCFRSAGWPSGSRLPLFGMHRFGVAARRVGASARRVGSSAFRFGDCRSVGWASGSRFGVALGELAFGLTASAFRHAPLRSCPRRVGASAFRFGVAARRVGLRAHCFRFSARIDPHRRTAEARTDGAQRHDNCFTSKHLSQHVNLPHRTPQALQNRQTPLLSPTRHPRGRRPHAHHRAHREEVHPGFGRREGRGRRTRGRDHRQSPTGTQRATRRSGFLPSHPPLLGGRGLARTGGRGADQASARGVPPLVAHSSRPLREGPRCELRAARQKEARRQRATGRFAHGRRYAGSTRAFDGFLGRRLGRDASGYPRACDSLDGYARGNTCACRAFAHDVDHHGYTRAFDGLLGRGLGCDASGYARACASLDGNAFGYAGACRAFAHDVDHHGYTRAFDGLLGRGGSLTLAHGATPCRRPLRRTAFRLAPHPAERDSAGALLI